MTVTNPDKPSVIKKRAYLLLAAYGITLLFLLPYVEYFIFFPFGLFYFFRYIRFFDHVDAFLMIGVGWVLYLAITISIIFARRKTVFKVLYLILVLLLIINIGGCYAQNRELEMAFPNL